jgi:competence protein ComEC
VSTTIGWPDLRLAAPAIACWLSAIGALYLPASRGVLVAVAAAAATVVATLTGRRRWVLVGVLLGVVCGAASTAARVAVRDAEPLAGLARDRVSVTADLVVTDDPRPLRGSTGRPPTYAVPAELTHLRHEAVSVRLSARVLVLAGDRSWRSLLPGQQVTAVGRLGPPHRGDLRAAVLSVTAAPLSVGAPPWAQRAAERLRAGLRHACAPLPVEPGGLLPGLVVGDTSRLEPAVADDFTRTGMTHLVAVSGSNVAIVIGAVLLLTRWCRAGPRLAAILGAVALVGFVILVRPSPSVLRAAAMGALGLVALAAGRPRAAVPALAATVAVLVIVDPQLAVDAGFALSVLATAGLLLIAPRWRDVLRERGVPAGLAEALAIPAAAQVACAPVIAAISGTVGLAAVPANLLAVPAVAPATVLGVGAALLSVCWPAGAEWAAWLASWPARWLVLVARYGAEAPAGVAPWPAGVAGGLLLAALLGAALVGGRQPVVRQLVVVSGLAAILGVLPVRLVDGGWPPSGWLVVACDVGQGDAVVLPTGPGDAAVVDAGPDPAATDRCLGRLGVRHVSLLVITHFHVDHVAGIAGVFRGRSVAAIVTTAYPEPAAGHDAVLAAATAEHVPVHVAVAGSAYRLGAMLLCVLGPVRTVTGTRSDPNNNSLVLLATAGGRRVLLAGDAEEEEQHLVLDAVGASALRADVLKLAHHGSSYQDPAFLDAVAPAVALVSVGAGNPYGHPNAAVLARLARSGARVLRTDQDSDAAVVLTPDGLAVVVRGRDPGRHPP